MVKISDVAREAGVSVATVSRALNNLDTVRPDLAAQVHQAASRLGYRPNSLARNLRKQSTQVWALVISDIENPFFTAVARGVEDTAQQNGYSVMLCNSDEDPEKEARYLSVAGQDRVAGVILSPHSASTDVSSLNHIPLVVIDRALNAPFDVVLVHSRLGAEQATRHLLEQGWQRPACITGPEDAETAVERREGYLQALRGTEIEAQVKHQPFRSPDGAVATAALLDGDNPPDSFFVGNASLALGVLAELSRRGLKPGTDVGLISFDDAPWAPFIDPPISVVAQPAYDIGVQAAQLLVERIANTGPRAPREVNLATTLIFRESSRKLG
ncbi:LacI family transcriptional regulator [Psychromicrobium silvestre]|uniref:LacI family transcriptional regulator n=1 Tax=Psychromicrobium silvestre TaxID=1645614 RepID=A0A7Y9LW63_9MICC|nr:LacI family DNA-binding transcriptional regulator [Psychromicrobium silvestre]NYE96734.1 LacI family transcriptional regulator [Psychromicrobium silvestre]